MSPARRPDPDASIEQCLVRLDRALFSHRLVSSVALLLAAAAVALAVWQAGRSELTAQAIRLVDGQGAVRAELGLSDAGQPGVFVYGPEGTTRIWLGIHDTGKPRLMLGDETGKPRAILGLNDAGEPRLEFSDEQGQLVYQAPRGLGATPEERWTSLNTAGTRAFVAGRADDARNLYQAALQQARQFGDADLRLAATLNNLGVVHLQAGETGQAEEAYSQALAIREKLLGERHPQVAQSLGNLALLRVAQQRFDDAEALFRRSLAILEQAYGTDDPRLANTLGHFVELLRSRGQDAEAARLQQQLDGLSATPSTPTATER